MIGVCVGGWIGATVRPSPQRASVDCAQTHPCTTQAGPIQQGAPQHTQHPARHVPGVTKVWQALNALLMQAQGAMAPPPPSPPPVGDIGPPSPFPAPHRRQEGPSFTRCQHTHTKQPHPRPTPPPTCHHAAVPRPAARRRHPAGPACRQALRRSPPRRPRAGYPGAPAAAGWVGRHCAGDWRPSAACRNPAFVPTHTQRVFAGVVGCSCRVPSSSWHPQPVAVTHTLGVSVLSLHRCWCPRRRVSSVPHPL